MKSSGLKKKEPWTSPPRAPKRIVIEDELPHLQDVSIINFFAPNFVSSVFFRKLYIGSLKKNKKHNNMKDKYLQGVADYLNNKFGSDYTMTEPHPEWISQEDEQMLDIDFDSWCEAMDDWYERTHNAYEDEEKNIIKELVLFPRSIPDNQKQLNLIGYWR